MIQLSTKAQTLNRLTGKLKHSRILPLFYFTVGEWLNRKNDVLEKLLVIPWSKEKLIVRSSGVSEDSELESLAGYYESVLNVKGPENITKAIDKVIASYGDENNADNEVLIQPMLENVLRSGVAFTSDSSTGSPYWVIEWVDSHDTTAVTSGENSKSYYWAKVSPNSHPKKLDKIFQLLSELVVTLKQNNIDVEFAETNEDIYLLQVRPLVMKQKQVDVEQHKLILNEISSKVRNGIRPHPFLHGNNTVYGVMPDWNPAEIIGTRPRPLALSLYRELITNATWAYQRNNYGYKNLRSHPLLIDFCGLPYVDVRVSFNSFIPKDIEKGLADRLVDYYLKRLIENPQYHDKVEFDVVYTCYTFDLDHRMKRLREAGFSENDCNKLKDSLREVTNRIINTKSGLWKSDAERVEVLTSRRKTLYETDTDHITRIYWLLEDCKRYGTLPFAGLARAGFISVSLLRSLVTQNVLSEEEKDLFINSLNAITSQLPSDLMTMDKSTFLNKYGHLRPGTYDILSYRYDEKPEMYFDWQNKPAYHPSKKTFRLSLVQMKKISELLEVHGLENDVIGFFDFLKAGIELRESSKFEFTRNLSDALSLITDFGSKFGFTREDLSFLNIDAIYELYRSSGNPYEILKRSIETGKDNYIKTCSVILPPLIVNEADIWGFELPDTEPNFITQKRIQANVTQTKNNNNDLSGKIVCIVSADPGYDWLFSHPISGLITCYGGANSHMAIRANELGIPAVIGSGETNYQLWSSSKRIDLDCANRRVEVIS